MAGDRRATAGNIVVYDRADKVLEIDRHSVMAIAGVPATAWEMARVLGHSFQFYRRTQLQEMSVDGKVRALSKLLRDNFGFVMQGVGVVVPLFATYDSGPAAEGKLYFYDVMGANFEVAEYAATGSGSPAVRGVLYYENTWGAKPLREYGREDALRLVLRALDTASEADTATGGVDRNGRIFPIIKIITAGGSRRSLTTRCASCSTPGGICRASRGTAGLPSVNDHFAFACSRNLFASLKPSPTGGNTSKTRSLRAAPSWPAITRAASCC